MSICVGVQAQPSTSSADFDLRVGVGYSDNIRRVVANPESMRFDFLGFRSNFVRDGNRLDARVLSDIEARRYSDDTIETEPVGSLNARVDFELAPERLSWFASDNYGQGSANPFAPTAPDNRQDINIFTTGPQLTLPLGQRTTLLGSAIRSDNDFGNPARLDYAGRIYTVDLNRALNATATAGFGTNSREIEFEDSQNDSDTLTVYLSYARSLASGNVSVRLGRTKLEFSTFENDTPFMNIDWVRGVGARSRLSLGLTRDYSDLAGQFVRNNFVGASGPRPEDVILTANIFQFTRANVGLAINYPRTTWSVGGTVGELRYENAGNFDNDEISFFLGVTHRPRPRMQLSLFLRNYEREFAQLNVENRDRASQLAFTQEFGRRYFLSATLLHSSRGGSGATSPYDESVFRLSLGIDLNP